MKLAVYSSVALVAFLVATVGSDMLARMNIAQQTLGQAASEHLYYALTDWWVTILLLAPFVAVGIVSAAVQKWGRTRSAIAVFATGTNVRLGSLADRLHSGSPFRARIPD